MSDDELIPRGSLAHRGAAVAAWKYAAEDLDRHEWIEELKAKCGIVTAGDDLDVVRGRLFGDRERAKASLQVEEEILRREVPFEFEAIARRLGEYLPEGYSITFGPVTEIDPGEDEP